MIIVQHFFSPVLRPEITVADAADIDLAMTIQQEIHKVCIIVISVNLDVFHEPEYVISNLSEINSAF